MVVSDSDFGVANLVSLHWHERSITLKAKETPRNKSSSYRGIHPNRPVPFGSASANQPQTLTKLQTLIIMDGFKCL